MLVVEILLFVGICVYATLVTHNTNMGGFIHGKSLVTISKNFKKIRTYNIIQNIQRITKHSKHRYTIIKNLSTNSVIYLLRSPNLSILLQPSPCRTLYSFVFQAKK